MFLVVVMGTPSTYIAASCRKPDHLTLEDTLQNMAEDICITFPEVSRSAHTYRSLTRVAQYATIAKLHRMAKARNKLFVHLMIVAPNIAAERQVG
jgi:hypothetical protein